MDDKLKYTKIGLYIYNGLLFVVNLFFGLFLFSALSLAFVNEVYIVPDMNDQSPDPVLMVLSSLVVIFIFLLSAVHFVGLLTVGRQRAWVWVYQIIVVSLGFGSILTVVPSIFLLIGLLTQEVQDLYKHPELSNS